MNQAQNSEKLKSGKVAWKSPSNIALVKYWGKHGNQLPRNPSLSITLREAVTHTEFEYHVKPTGEGLTVDFFFEKKPATAFRDRILGFLEKRMPAFPFLNNVHLTINSNNTFPHSSGIASSASAFSSIALCISSIQQTLSGNQKKGNDFYRQASGLARLGSGSAGRSVYGGYVVWGALDGFNEYSDDYAVPILTDVHPVFKDIQDAILIVSDQKKKVGSTAGHALMEGHPFAGARYDQAIKNMNSLHHILKTSDLDGFVEIVENEALSLHALMMASNPGYLLMEYNTIQIIEKIRAFRIKKNIPVCFTLDAGPNVHLLYPNEYKAEVVEWIDEDLSEFCSGGKWIDDGIGQGPEQI